MQILLFFALLSSLRVFDAIGRGRLTISHVLGPKSVVTVRVQAEKSLRHVHVQFPNPSTLQPFNPKLFMLNSHVRQSASPSSPLGIDTKVGPVLQKVAGELKRNKSIMRVNTFFSNDIHTL